MASTFFGLETARRALSTQQTALLVTGHNVSNANTPGYSRQRVNFSTTSPFPTPGIDQARLPGQLGTGVAASSIQRIRDSFSDMQYRTETSKLGYWASKADMLSQMEGIMNEPSDTGLSATMDQFWNALQDLAVQPQNDGARRVVRERGITLANTFNYMSNSLKAIQKDFRSEIETTQKSANILLKGINDINKQIGQVEPNGFLPNDLYDERDRLLDELSTIMNIKVEYKPAGGLSSSLAEGYVDVYLATPEGDILTDKSGKKIKLVDSLTKTATGIHVQFESREEADSPVSTIKFFDLDNSKSGFAGVLNIAEADATTNVRYQLEEFSNFNSNGTLRGYIEGYGYTENGRIEDGGTLRGTYNDMLADLDLMAYTFAMHFNTVHDAGWSLNEIRSGDQETEGNFFDFTGGTLDPNNIKGAAAKLKVADNILTDIQNIAAAAEGNVLAGMMNRVPDKVTAGTVGNPIYTGIFNPKVDSASGLLDGSGNPFDWETVWGTDYDFKNLKNVTVEAKASVDTDNKVTWNFDFTIVDSDGTEHKATFVGAQEEIKFNLFGIDFDMSKISSVSTDDSWNLTFAAEGKKSSEDSFIGDGSNALALADVKDALIDFGGNLTNVQAFYQGMIGELGVAASEANRMMSTSAVLQASVEERRMSISAVSLDEEMTNMIQFQHAYNAAARQITVIDEMLDKIINGMGVVGR